MSRRAQPGSCFQRESSLTHLSSVQQKPGSQRFSGPQSRYIFYLTVIRKDTEQSLHSGRRHLSNALQLNLVENKKWSKEYYFPSPLHWENPTE